MSSDQTLNQSTSVDSDNLLDQLKRIEERASKLAKYELTTPLSIDEFQGPLNASDSATRKLAADLLKPYVESLEGRLDAVNPIFQQIDRIVVTINRFLSDKTISFKLSQGISIKNSLDAVLDAAQLSSGEQQLILLFCYVLTGRDRPSVFMIDEPEISLNVKWQRQLIDSLLQITEGANVQFIFASHSIELLSQHKNRVIKLAKPR